MNIVLLDAKTLGDDLDISILQKFGTLTIYQTTSSEQTLERIISADIIITNKVVIDAKILNQLSSLQLICIAATGMNNVDLDVAKEKGIEVKNVEGYSTTSVVQHTFAMTLYLIEKISYYDNFVKSGSWTKSKLFTNIDKPFFEISGKRWGIIGLGAIGQKVASIATAFGAKVSYFSTSGDNLSQPYPHMKLNDLLQHCDIISIHCPLNKMTYNLINHSNLTLIRKGSILLNLGRGSIVNEVDLADTLNKKELYAGLDVLTPEPILKDNPLMHINHQERLLITPHIAWTTIEARKKLLTGIVKNIENFLEK